MQLPQNITMNVNAVVDLEFEFTSDLLPFLSGTLSASVTHVHSLMI